MQYLEFPVAKVPALISKSVFGLQSPHGVPVRHGGSPKFAVKTRQAFFLHTSQMTKTARRVCQDLLRSKYLARHPYTPVNTAAIKAECEFLQTAAGFVSSLM